VYTDECNKDFILLCHLLDAFLNELVGGEEHRSEYIQYNTLNDIHDIIVAYDGNIPVGCASFKHYEDGIAEVKRVFVKNTHRGQGVSKHLMTQLEEKAKEKGYSKFVLECGEPLETAMSLYRSIGFRTIPNYGPYINMQESVCMEKALVCGQTLIK